jgi:hypothetical protein
VLPGFSANSSLYLTRSHYRAGFAFGNVLAPLATRTTVLQPQAGACGSEDCKGGCSHCPNSNAVEDSCCLPSQPACEDGLSFRGCCDTACNNADGSAYCCNADDGGGGDLLCCGDGRCVSTTDEIDPCTACSNACVETATCCKGATELGPNFNEYGNAPYCTDTSTDSNNCGGCGVVCRGGQVCVKGSCVGIKLNKPVTPVRTRSTVPVHAI